MTKKQRKRAGFSLAEALIVVAITLILAGLAFVAVYVFQRSYRQLEYDGIAKEIFVAAQNHLSAANSQNYLSRTKNRAADPFGTEEMDGNKGTGIFYFVVGGDGSGSTDPTSDETILSLMLPLASVDETVRLGGSYIIRYNRDEGVILDVFYSNTGDGRYGHTYSSSEYDTLFTGDENGYADYFGTDGTVQSRKSARRTYTDDSVLGYYGCVQVEKMTVEPKFASPVVTVTNGNKLVAHVYNPNGITIDGTQLRLIVTGKTSGNSKYLTLISNGSSATAYAEGGSSVEYFDIVLDDITTPGQHFSELFGTATSAGSGFIGGALIPGEDIEIKAVAFSTAFFTNIAESTVHETNSLFSDATDAENGHAGIDNFRHLENLSNEVSGLNLSYTSADQSNDLNWPGFLDETGASGVCKTDSSVLSAGTYFPVEHNSQLAYAGNEHTITGVVVKEIQKDGGLFASLRGGSSVSDLQLVDFNVKSTNGNAGALVGNAVETEISGVLVRNGNLRSDADYEITGAGYVGGLAGTLSNCTVDMSAAAVYVKSTSASGVAGGLIGAVNGTSVMNSYAGGHTSDALYSTAETESTAGRVNVIAGSNAGGLIGSATNGSSVQYCYATTSAKAGTSGGLIGAADTVSVQDSYATGLVLGDQKGAFIGSADSPTLSRNKYYGIINEGLDAIGNQSGEPAAAQLAALDENLVSYAAFVVSDTPAFAYDANLVFEFKGKSDMPGVSVLNSGDLDWPAYLYDSTASASVHYGDWPSPETKIVNVLNATPQGGSSSGQANPSPAVGRVSVAHHGTAGIPSGAVLSAKVVDSSDKYYNGYISGIESLGIRQGADDRTELLDLTIMSGSMEIQPTGGVDVRIQIAHDSSRSEEDVTVVHFSEDGPEKMVLSLEGDVISFRTESFSVYAIILHEGDQEVVNPRVEFHFLSQVFQETSTPGTYTADFFRFYNKGDSMQTSQILKNGETLEMIANPPNISVEGKPKYFFGWYPVYGTDNNGTVTYTWPDDPEQIHFELPLSMTPSSGLSVGDQVAWTIGDVSGTAVLDGEGTAHVYLAPIYEDYYFVNYHLGAKESDIWGTILFRRLIVLGDDDLAIVRIGTMTAPSTDTNRQVFAGWETANTTEQQKVDEHGVPVWIVGSSEVAAAQCPEGGTPEMIDVPTSSKQIFKSVDPATGTENTGTVRVSDGSDFTPAQATGYHIAVTSADLDGGNSIDLYPVFAEARWILFNTGKSGSGATYVPSQYLLTSDLVQNGSSYDSPYYVVKLPEGDQPLRNGYQFMGWYADAVRDSTTGEITNLTEPKPVTYTYTVGGTDVSVTENLTAKQITDSNGNIVGGNYRKTITDGVEVKLLYEIHNGKLYVYNDLENLTLYADWQPVANTTMQVNVWKQKVTDEKTTADSQKTYDYERDYSYSVAVNSGMTLEQLRTNNKLRLNGAANGTNVEAISEQGFHYRTTVMSTAKVASDGTTVVNVYYDRDLITFNYYTYSRNGYTATTSNSGTQYAFVGDNWEVLSYDTDSGTWKIPERGDVYTASNAMAEVMYGLIDGQYVELTPVTNSTTIYTADYRYSTATNNTGTQYVLQNGVYSAIEYSGGYWYLKVGTASNGVSNDLTYANDQTYYRRETNSYSQIYYRNNRWRTGNSNNGNTFTGDIYQRYTGTRYTRSNDGVTDVTNNSSLNTTELYYIDGNGGRVPVSVSTTVTVTGYTYQGTEYTGTRYLKSTGLTGRYVPYTGTRYVVSSGNSNAWRIYKVFTGLYGQTLTQNGYVWDTAYDWYSSYSNGAGSGTRTTFLDAFLPTERTTTVNFYSKTPEGSNKIYFYKQKLNPDGTVSTDYEVANSVSSNATGFNLSDKYNGFKCTSWKSGDNGTLTAVGELMNQNGNWYYDANPSQSGYQTASISTSLHIYFNRKLNSITFVPNYPNMAGLWSEGGTPSEEKVVSGIPYESSILRYGSTGADYWIPNIPPHYTFQGWFEDAACTVPFNFNSTMPAGDKIVYAGWKAVKFRINLDANGGEIDHIDHRYSNPDQGYNNYWYNADGDVVLKTISGENNETVTWQEYIPKTKKFVDITDPSKYGVTPLATFNRSGEYRPDDPDAYRTDQSTYFNGTYKETVGYYDMTGTRQYVEISNAEANNLGSGNWFYYLNSITKPTDGSGLPADLRNALYLTEAQVDEYYNFYVDWVTGNILGEYISGTQILGKEAWKDAYLAKDGNGNFQKYRRLYPTETYTFLGWYKILYDDLGNEIGPESMPYNFSDPITGPMTLRAYWRLDGGYRVHYIPDYIMGDGTFINAQMEAWTDPQVASSTYADGAKTHIYRQPTGILANGSETDGENYIFRGWQLVSVRTVDGNVISTPLEDNVFYDPGDPFTISAGYADPNGLIHFQAVYEKRGNAYRRPEVASLILDANSGYVTKTGTEPLDGGYSFSWDGKGDIFLDGDTEQMVFGYYEDQEITDHLQTGRTVRLYRYATDLSVDAKGNTLSPAGQNYFRHDNRYLLIGFDDAPDEHDYLATYPADSMISVERKDNKTIYAVWEPMVYLNFVNNTNKKLTFSISSSEGALTIVNVKYGLYGRTPLSAADMNAIEIEPGETLMFAVPEGAERHVTVTITNDLGIGKSLSWDTSLTVGNETYNTAAGTEPISYTHSDGDVHVLAKGHVNNTLTGSFTEKLLENKDGITVTFDDSDNDYALVLEGNFPGAGYQEFDYSLTAVNAHPSRVLPSTSTRPGGYQFLGWAFSSTATVADYSATKPDGSPWTVEDLYEFFNGNPLDPAHPENTPVQKETITTTEGSQTHTLTIGRLYAVWTINKEANTVFIYKDVPLPGNQDMAFEFTLNLYGVYKWKKNNSTTYTNTLDESFTFELHHGEYAVLVSANSTEEGYLETKVTIYNPDGTVKTQEVSCRAQVQDGQYGNGGSFSGERITVTETPVTYYTTTVSRTAQAENPSTHNIDYPLFVGDSTDETTIPLEAETNRLSWKSTYAGGTAVFTNTRQTVDVTVKKVLEGAAAAAFNFTASYEADGRTVNLGGFTVNSNDTDGTTLSQIPKGAVLTITENGPDLLNYETTAKRGDTDLIVTKPASTTSSGVTTHYRAVTQTVEEDATITFRNVLKSIPVKIVKIGSDGTTTYNDVEAQFNLTSDHSSVFAGRYSSPVTAISPRGNIVFETGETISGENPDPRLYVGEYTLEETKAFGDYIKLNDEIPISVVGTEDGAELQIPSGLAGVSLTRAGDVWVVTVTNRKTIQISVRTGLLDPMASRRSFTITGSYMLDGVKFGLDGLVYDNAHPYSFDLTAFSTNDGSVSSAQDPVTLTIPVGATDLVIREDTSKVTVSPETIGTTYDIAAELNTEGRLDQSQYTFATVTNGNNGDVVTFYNRKKTVNITIRKVVDTDDKTGTFSFTATLLNGNTPILSYPIFINDTPLDVSDDLLTHASDGTYTFTLADGGEHILTIPVGAKLTVREMSVSGNATGDDLDVYATVAGAKLTEGGTTYGGGTSYSTDLRRFTLSSAPSTALTVTFTNGSGAKEIYFKKIDGFGDPLGYAQFSFYDTYENALSGGTTGRQLVGGLNGGDEYSKVPYTESIGSFLISGSGVEYNVYAKLPVNTVDHPYWYMREVNNPNSNLYEPNPYVYRVKVLNNGNYTVERLKSNSKVDAELDVKKYGIINISKFNRKVILKKSDQTFSFLEDAVFEIYYYDMTKMNWDDSHLNNSSNNENGVFFVGSLPYGYYYLKETQRPNGVPAPSTGNWWYTLRVDGNGVTVMNDGKPSEVPWDPHEH